jgi:hypothetical protein
MTSTRNLYRISDAALLPYPRPDDEPVIGLDRSAYKVVKVVQLPKPQHDPATEQLTGTEAYAWLADAPDATGLDGTLTRGWQVDPIVPPPPPEPAADWEQFKKAMLSNPETNDALAAALPLAPLAVLALPAALLSATLGSPEDLCGCWLSIRRTGAVPEPTLQAIAAAAAASNLPAKIQEILA